MGRAVLLLTLGAAIVVSSNVLARTIDHGHGGRFEQSVRACLTNGSYVGGTVEDSRALFAQCLDDYAEMRGWAR